MATFDATVNIGDGAAIPYVEALKTPGVYKLTHDDKVTLVVMPPSTDGVEPLAYFIIHKGVPKTANGPPEIIDPTVLAVPIRNARINIKITTKS